jgi:hypothetical protein
VYFCSPCLQSYRDNPKINAIVLVKGGLEDWPKLPPVPVEPEEDDLTEEHKVVLSSHSVCTPRRYSPLQGAAGFYSKAGHQKR